MISLVKLEENFFFLCCLFVFRLGLFSFVNWKHMVKLLIFLLIEIYIYDILMVM